MIQNLLIIGGNSDIAYALILATAKCYPLHKIFLASSNETALIQKAIMVEQQTRINTKALFLDLTDLDSIPTFYENLPSSIDAVFICAGYLNTDVTSIKEAKKIALVNYVGPSLLLDYFTKKFLAQNSGLIVGISSVAGLRGRASNYHYGAAKAAFTTYLSGLRNRVSNTSIQVMTVLPGFVETKMTRHLALPKLLTTTPSKVANSIVAAIQHQKDLIYVTWYWRYMMWIIKLIPEKIFKRLKL